MNLIEYNKYPSDDTVIRSGLISNSPTGCFISSNKDILLLKFVVVKYLEGWKVYFDKPIRSDDYIRVNGNEVYTENFIRNAFPCDEDVFKLYVP